MVGRLEAGTCGTGTLRKTVPFQPTQCGRNRHLKIDCSKIASTTDQEDKKRAPAESSATSPGKRSIQPFCLIRDRPVHDGENLHCTAGGVIIRANPENHPVITHAQAPVAF